MILDKQLILHGSYDGPTGVWTGGSLIANATAETECTNVIDTGGTNTLKDLGTGKPLYLVILITTSVAAGGGAANITFNLGSDATTTIAGGTDHWTSAAIAKGTLVAGYLIAVPLPPKQDYERYLGVTFTPDTNNITAGKALIAITDQLDAWKAYADSLNIAA